MTTVGKYDVFGTIYDTNSWTEGSGPGSLVEVNREYLELLANFFKWNNIKRVADIGCGDFQLMRHFDFSNIEYIGYDVVSQVIARNKSVYSTNNIEFRDMPDDVAEIEGGDIVLIKDVLIHLENEEVTRLLTVLSEKFRFVLTVNDINKEGIEANAAITTGQFRPIDVTKPPFSFNASTILVYSKDVMPNPRIPMLLAKLTRQYIYPGKKHVQLLLGTAKQFEAPKSITADT